VPVVVTLDLHGNITEKMAANANALIAVRTYPAASAHSRPSLDAVMRAASVQAFRDCQRHVVLG
jgi:microcystin degradation protein MlrC